MTHPPTHHSEREGQSQRRTRGHRSHHLPWGRAPAAEPSLTEDLNPQPEGSSPPEGGSPVGLHDTAGVTFEEEPCTEVEESPHVAGQMHADTSPAVDTSLHADTSPDAAGRHTNHNSRPADVLSTAPLDKDPSLPPALSTSSTHPFAHAARSALQAPKTGADDFDHTALPLGGRSTERSIPMLTPLTQSFTYGYMLCIVYCMHGVVYCMHGVYCVCGTGILQSFCYPFHTRHHTTIHHSMADTAAFRKRLSHHTAVTLEDLSLATHYMKFAFAAYGYKLYVVAMFGVVGRCALGDDFPLTFPTAHCTTVHCTTAQWRHCTLQRHTVPLVCFGPSTARKSSKSTSSPASTSSPCPLSLTVGLTAPQRPPRRAGPRGRRPLHRGGNGGSGRVGTWPGHHPSLRKSSFHSTPSCWYEHLSPTVACCDACQRYLSTLLLLVNPWHRRLQNCPSTT